MASDNENNNIFDDAGLSRFIKRIKSFLPQKLATARKISAGTAVTSTATAFDGSADITIPVTGVKEAYLNWGGKDIAGAVSPVDAAMIENMSANRLSFMKTDAITIEYSTDGGTTWTDYGATTREKIRLVTNTAASTYFYFGHHTAAGSGTVDDQLRITISAKAASIYFNLRKIAIYMTTSGATVLCNIENSTIAAPATFKAYKSNISLAGWSGWNIIQFKDLFGGGDSQTSHIHTLRFTFRCTTASTASSPAPGICRIYMFGETMWSSTHQMQLSGRMYDFDENQRVSFPGGLAIGSDATADNDVPTKKQLDAKISNTDVGLSAAINKLGTGKSTPTDTDYYVCQYAGGGTTTTSYHRRPMSALWNYIKSKADTIYAAVKHSHTKADITDFPTSMPASDVSAWAKAATKPAYTKSEIGFVSYKVTFAASGWSDSAPYTQTVAVDGMTDTKLHIWLDRPDDFELTKDNVETYDEAFNCIDDIETGSGTVTATCTGDKPSCDVVVVLEG